MRTQTAEDNEANTKDYPLDGKGQQKVRESRGDLAEDLRNSLGVEDEGHN